MGRLITTSEGSCASSPSRRSAGGQDEQPWLVNNSTTARGSAPAGVVAKAATAARRAGNTARVILKISTPRASLLLEHDLFRKPVPTFRDHALAGADNLIMRGAIPRHSIHGEGGQ